MKEIIIDKLRLFKTGRKTGKNRDYRQSNYQPGSNRLQSSHARWPKLAWLTKILTPSSLYLLLSLLLGSLPVQAAIPASPSLEREYLTLDNLPEVLDTLLNGLPPELNFGTTVLNLETGQELYSKNADKLLIPASNIKIISTAAALYYLTPDYQFKTEIFGEMNEKGIIPKNLYLKGYGDPYLLNEKIYEMANKLAFAKLREVQGDLIVDDSYFSGERFNFEYEDDNSPYAYMAPSNALSANYNSIFIHIFPGLTKNSKALILFEPASSYPLLQNNLLTKANAKSNPVIDITPTLDHDLINITGVVNLQDSKRTYVRRINNPAFFTGEIFLQALKRIGIKVRGKIRQEGQAPPLKNLLVRALSPRLAELIIQVNKHSNNFMAAQIAETLAAEVYGAPGTWEKASLAIENFLDKEVGLKKGSYRLANASGLHKNNQFSAKQMVQILNYIYHNPRIGPEFISSLAVAGASGTLQERMYATAAEGILRAKTGTLNKVSALSGYLTTPDGTPLAFSLLVNGHLGDPNKIREIQDNFGIALAKLNLRSITKL